MSTNLNFRAYLPEDEYGILDLLKASFPKWMNAKNALKLWRWKYLESPQKPAIEVVTDNDKIVGVNQELFVRLKIGDTIHLASYPDDTAVHPDYRSRGIYSRMLKDSQESKKIHGVEFTYYATENPIISETDKKYGYRRFPCYISHLVKIIDSDVYLKEKKRDNLLTKLGVSALTRYSGIKHAFSPQPKTMGNYTIEVTSSFDDRINTFWNEVKSSYSYIIEKTPEYMNWRIRKPGENNVVRLAIEGERVLGYIVISMDKEKGYLDGKINDLLAVPDRLDVVDGLITSACESLEDTGAAAVYYPATKGHPYEALVQRHGFIDASRLKSSYFEYKIHSSQIDESYIENISPSRVQLQHF